MSNVEPSVEHNSPSSKVVSRIVILFAFVNIGIIGGGILGTFVVIALYVVSGAFLGVMAGSGFIGLTAIPLMALGFGGVPGAVIGTVIGIVLGILIVKRNQI
jgi:hypothetical protein